LIAGDVPQGAGLSSSAAVELAVAGALTALCGAEVAPQSLALLCQKAENLFVGVQCGIMDQLASALGSEGSALFIDCRSLESEPVPLPEGLAIVVIDSKVPRNLGDTAYNRRREECAEAAQALGVESLRDATPEMLAASRSAPGDVLLRRARHVVTENERVVATAAALRSGDLDALGRLFAESHASLRDRFEVSSPELDTLVDIAVGVPGVVASRMTGAGFGGCTVTLAHHETVDRLRERILRDYPARTGRKPRVWVVRAVDGAGFVGASSHRCPIGVAADPNDDLEHEPTRPLGSAADPG
jgi:galactokinase